LSSFIFAKTQNIHIKHILVYLKQIRQIHKYIYRNSMNQNLRYLPTTELFLLPNCLLKEIIIIFMSKMSVITKFTKLRSIMVASSRIVICYNVMYDWSGWDPWSGSHIRIYGIMMGASSNFPMVGKWHLTSNYRS
jgi:hypothetical protein